MLFVFHVFFDQVRVSKNQESIGLFLFLFLLLLFCFFVFFVHSEFVGGFRHDLHEKQFFSVFVLLEFLLLIFLSLLGR